MASPLTDKGTDIKTLTLNKCISNLIMVKKAVWKKVGFMMICEL